MFESVTRGFDTAMSFFRSGGKLTEANIDGGLRQVRQALLEADVNYEVVQSFTDKVKAAALGQQLLQSVNPSQQFVHLLHQQLTELMGPVDHAIPLKKGDVTILMMCGLQGSGKTTTCGKLVKMLQSEGVSPMLVAADLQRPAAIDQLKILGEQLGVPVHAEDPSVGAVKVCQNGVALARKQNHQVVILDTAGRLHIDADLMKELEEVDRRVRPHQVFLVCDAMTGQDAVNSAKAFNDALELDGVILTKLDGDARGGAALSIKAVTGVPIKFVGMGEQLDKLEKFHPERMASRILGMGDVVSLVEKAQQQFTAEQIEEQQKKLASGNFTLLDFKNQLGQIKRMGSIMDLMKMIPGMGKVADMFGQMNVDPEKEMKRVEAIINSMTPAERTNPELIDHSRRRRIARGSGSTPVEVNGLLKQFDEMAGMMKKMSGMGMYQRFQAMRQMGDAGMFHPDAQIQVQKERSKRGMEDKKAAEEKKKKMRKEAKAQKKKNRR
jgi:signal recognition particle subunit SRP54